MKVLKLLCKTRGCLYSMKQRCRLNSLCCALEVHLLILDKETRGRRAFLFLCHTVVTSLNKILFDQKQGLARNKSGVRSIETMEEIENIFVVKGECQKAKDMRMGWRVLIAMHGTGKGEKELQKARTWVAPRKRGAGRYLCICKRMPRNGLKARGVLPELYRSLIFEFLLIHHFGVPKKLKAHAVCKLSA